MFDELKKLVYENIIKAFFPKRRLSPSISRFFYVFLTLMSGEIRF